MANKKRYFGIHFDCHLTPEKCKGIKIGETLKKEDIEEICESLKPDFIQIDCKGHPGYTSYPTRVGTAAAEFSFDPLKLWREVTKKYNVGLYMHYSGVWDKIFMKNNPECARIDADGTRNDEGFSSVFGDYVDRLMIPQIKEVIGYGVDGMWVDGDCWATKVEGSQKALDLFFEKTGIRLQNSDLNKQNEHYEEYREFCRQGFRDYLEHYVSAAHKADPDFKIASNWAYSEQMPEAVETSVDFLSGDYNPADSFNGAVFGGRILAGQKMPWDLMAWGNRRHQDENQETIGSGLKHSEQLKQEAAAVLSLGGGFQVYLKQDRCAAPDMVSVRSMTELSEFIREREPFCFEGEQVRDVAIFNSTYDHAMSLPEGLLFGNHGTYNGMYGWSKLLSDSGHNYSVLEEHNLFPEIDKYKMIVCPNVNTAYTSETVEKLRNYAENGGVLVLGGKKTADLFTEFCGAFEKISDAFGVCSVDKKYWGEHGGATYSVNSDGETIAFAAKKADYQNTVDFVKVASVKKGKIVVMGSDLGAAYNRYKSVAVRKIGEKLLGLYTPTVEISGTHFINLNVLKKENRLLIQFVNSGGVHSDPAYDSFDEILPISNITVRVNCKTKPKSVIWQPKNVPLSFVYKNGTAEFTMPSVHIHEIAEIKF